MSKTTIEVRRVNNGVSHHFDMWALIINCSENNQFKTRRRAYNAAKKHAGIAGIPYKDIAVNAS